MPFAGEGNPAAGRASPLAPRHGSGARKHHFVTGAGRGLLSVAMPGRGAAGRGAPAPWQRAGGLGKARVTQTPAGLPESPGSAMQAVGCLCRHIDQETVFCPRTVLWCGLLCACPWENDELFLCVLTDLDPYLAVLSCNLARVIHSTL